MNSSKRMGCILSAVIYVFLALGAALMIGIPWLMRPETGVLLGGRIVGMTALYIGGAAGIWMLIELLMIMKSVKAGDPFVRRNVSSLKRIAFCCAIACAAVALVLFFRFSLAFLLCALILAFGVLAAWTLALVFKRAVEYKEENDLTI